MNRVTDRILRFLQRPGALPTWRYERRVILAFEVLCQVAGILAAPTRLAALVMLVGAPFAVWQVELARASRSAEARKREQAAARGVPEVELTCARDIEAAARARQLATIAAPVVTLATSIATAGGKGLTLALVVGFVVSAVRVVIVELYGPWRRWYRDKVPPLVTLPVVVPSIRLVRVNRPVRAGEMVFAKDIERGGTE
jgi:hypothetical protein